MEAEAVEPFALPAVPRAEDAAQGMRGMRTLQRQEGYRDQREEKFGLTLSNDEIIVYRFDINHNTA